VDGVNGGRFLNGVAKVSTSLEPAELLALLQSIETRLGRPSEDRSRPRTIDLDILLYGQRVIRRPDLIVPHPRMTQRSFVMFPLVEIEPSLHHPVEMKTVKDMVWAAGSRPALTRCDSVSLSEVEGREPRA
jgi:2-amino-4-hydroxy-6-hydroxymethyldihydropteridine diphosphokinase